MQRCVKCGSASVITDGVVFDQDESLARPQHAGFQKKPTALIFTGNVSARLRAVICGDCGYVELYLEDAPAIYGAYRQAHGQSI